MNKTKHTPGPWLIRVDGTSTGRGPEIYVEGPHYDDGSKFVIAECGCSEHTDGGKRWKRTQDADQIEANAQVLTAAPELLEAAKLAVRILEACYPGPHKDWTPIRAAIAKAEGQ